MIGFYVVAKGIMTRDGKFVVHYGGTYKVFDIDRMVNAESPMFLIYSDRKMFEYVDSYYFEPDNDDDDDDLRGNI